ncbi:MAG: hypothetical protein K1060chlam2_01338 [Chlamydiae bacterium]|nr:hypothetical protein [Chlamydiota bacterium]
MALRSTDQKLINSSIIGSDSILFRSNFTNDFFIRALFLQEILKQEIYPVVRDWRQIN